MCVASETLEIQWSEVHRYSVMESIVYRAELSWIPTIQWIQFSSLDTPKHVLKHANMSMRHLAVPVQIERAPK